MSTVQKRDVDFDFETRIFLLKSSMRRELILVVAEHEELTLREAAEYIAAKKEGVDVDEITYHDQKGIYSPCSQYHAPKLEEYGIIEVDDDKVDGTELFATDLTQDVARMVETVGDVEIGGARA